MTKREIIFGVSVIVCCYNSANRLPQTLKHLSKQKVPSHVPWEVILVNNASTDETVKVAEKIWAENNPQFVPLIILEQPIPGLVHAKELGLAASNYEYCLFCDDDNWLSEDYVRISFEMMEKEPLVGALGGQGEDCCEICAPKWFHSFKGAYAVGPQAKESGDVSFSRGYVYGAGAVFRKSALFQLREKGFKSLLIGRKGETASSGEDKELCFGLLIIGFRIWYDERLKFKHFIPKERLTEEYAKKILNGFIQASPILTLYKYVINKREKKLRLLWLKDFIYTFYFEIKNIKHYTRFTKDFPKIHIAEMWRLSSSYKEIYNQIHGLHQPKEFKK